MGAFKRKKPEKKKKLTASCAPLTNYFSSATSISQHDEGTNRDHDANISANSSPRTSGGGLDLWTDGEARINKSTQPSILEDQWQPNTSAAAKLQLEEIIATEDSNVNSSSNVGSDGILTSLGETITMEGLLSSSTPSVNRTMKYTAVYKGSFLAKIAAHKHMLARWPA